VAEPAVRAHQAGRSPAAGYEFPVLWDVNLNNTRAMTLVKVVEEGLYIDEARGVISRDDMWRVRIAPRRTTKSNDGRAGLDVDELTAMLTLRIATCVVVASGSTRVGSIRADADTRRARTRARLWTPAPRRLTPAPRLSTRSPRDVRVRPAAARSRPRPSRPCSSRPHPSRPHPFRPRPSRPASGGAPHLVGPDPSLAPAATLRRPRYNPPAGLWALTTLQWSPQAGGNWAFRQATSVLDLDIYVTFSDKVQAGVEVRRLSRHVAILL
jgi:hypothetical protein